MSIRHYTPAELIEKAPRVKWIAKPWIAAGSITELVGKKKEAGKTTWTFGLVKAVLNGRQFCEGQCIKGPVVYLTEQPRSSLVEQLKKARLHKEDDLHFVLWSDTAHLPWPEVATYAAQIVEEVGAVLLVIDTLPQFALQGADQENDSGSALASLKPIQRILDHLGVGVLIIRHERKAAGSVGDAARGSSAYGAAVDTLLVLRRRRNAPTTRVMHGLGRFEDTPELTYMKLNVDDGQWELAGTEGRIKAAENLSRRAIACAVWMHDMDVPVSVAEIADEHKVTRTTAMRWLQELRKKKIIEQVRHVRTGSKSKLWMVREPGRIRQQKDKLKAREGDSCDTSETNAPA